MNRRSIYLDYAAATPVADEVFTAMKPFASENFYNPSATYTNGIEARNTLNTARLNTAHWLGAKNSEIIFTAGGTEANNLAIKGVMEQYPNAKIVVSAIEHDSVLSPARLYNLTTVNVDASGRLDIADLAKKIDDETVLVSIMYANNEIGTVQHLKDIAMLVMEKRRNRKNTLPLYFHTDACQAANYLDLHISRLGVDLMTLNGGKIYGPKQSGCLFVASGIVLKPLIDGGGQERGLRSGTENVAAIVGFSTALETAQSTRHDEVKRLQALQASFFEQLKKAIPNIVINGSTKVRLPNNIHLTIPDQDNERLLIELDEAGIMAAAGSACSASNEEPSHVLAAVGVSQSDAQASLRITMGRQTSQSEIDYTTKVLSQLVNK